MALNPFNWTPSTGLNDTNAFPAADKLFRVHLQSLLDQVKTYFNNDVKNELDSMANTASLNTNGWFKDKKTGLIFQWGTIAVTQTTGGTVTFPIAFPTQQVNVQAVINDVAFANVMIDATSKTNFHVKQSYTSALYIYWFAIGY